MKKERVNRMNIAELMRDRGKSGMVLISDVDGVHTSPKDGVKISARPSDKFGLSFTLQNGTEVLELVSPHDQAGNKEFCVGAFTGEEIIEFYQFHTPDGQAVINLLKQNVRTIIVSGRKAAPVYDRFDRKLGAETYLGVRDKLSFFRDFEKDFDFGNLIFISDGHQDAPLLQAISDAGGIAVATADCEDEAREASDAQTVAKGGEGAFAELALEYLSFIR